MKRISALFYGGELPDKDIFELPADGNTLFLVISAAVEREYLQAVLNSLKKISPDAVIIGASSDGAIADGQILDSGAVSVTAFVFEKTDFLSTTCSSNEEISEKVPNILKENTKLILLFASDVMSQDGDVLIDAVHKVLLGVPVAGGFASAPAHHREYLICGEKILQKCAVLVSLNSDDLSLHIDRAFGWQKTGRSFKIVEADGNRIISISGISPVDLFKRYLGSGVVDALPEIGSAFPLMIRRDGRVIARGIVGVDKKSFILSGGVRAGDEVYIGYGNPHTILKENTIHEGIYSTVAQPDLIFNFYCRGRRDFLPRRMVKYEISLLNSLAPVYGIFTRGEFFAVDDGDLLNFTSVAIALKEGGSAQKRKVNFPSPPRMDKIGLVAEGLFHFIDVRARELKSLAFYDTLTGLPNKHLFEQILERAISSSLKKGGSGLLFLIDIDNFKDINDTVGHNEGDAVLRLLAQRLERGLDQKKRLCRIGGDEFVIVAEEMADEQQMRKFAKELLAKLKERIELGHRSYHLTASIGITRFFEGNDNKEEIVKQADIAMYRAKQSGKNRWCLYRDEMGKEALERYRLEQELRSAIANREFVLYYQPQFDMNGGRIVGMEALVRWKHPKRGLLYPDCFIDVAESSGLIIPLGEIVLDMALEFLSNCDTLDRISVNISAVQFADADFFDKLTALIQKHGVDPSRLELEMTESVVMDDESETTELLFALAKEGIRLSIDDFGKGYSSLSYLKRMPIDTLKIDRSFVMDIPKNSSDAAIVRSMLAMARALELNVVAEGIETNDQVEFFKEEGDVVAQGYFYSRPLPHDEAKTLLRCL